MPVVNGYPLIIYGRKSWELWQVSLELQRVIKAVEKLREEGVI